MNQVYLINDAVYFYAEQGRLLNHHNGCEAALSQAGVRCFLALLDSPGEVVSANALIYAGWGSQGIVVTSNSLRQIINQLRKAIRKVGLPDDAIITQPRIGYKLSHAINATFSDRPVNILPNNLPAIVSPGAASSDAEAVLTSNTATAIDARATDGDAASIKTARVSIPNKTKKKGGKRIPYLTRYGTFWLFVTCVIVSVWSVFLCVRHVEIVTPYECNNNISFAEIDGKHYFITVAYHNAKAEGKAHSQGNIETIKRDKLTQPNGLDDYRVVNIKGIYHADTFFSVQCK
ncbi:winged helix-turn-helix domain-containing protein [Pantoea eucrina]|uniref:Winged helix-turn-helix domain-containing protein n=1 Tax=Pantoea eucrina TaxID=472693 RepID=A0ABU5LHC3_9GAMM|nr:winged helix-turn-helix domain-containing protein [Pantoea eucrina]MDZ7279335.1 winged helix-turn-helix domain-containing protein [Pantoea eucrina]